jgi:hypothetical protein
MTLFPLLGLRACRKNEKMKKKRLAKIFDIIIVYPEDTSIELLF